MQRMRVAMTAKLFDDDSSVAALITSRQSIVSRTTIITAYNYFFNHLDSPIQDNSLAKEYHLTNDMSIYFRRDHRTKSIAIECSNLRLMR